MTKKIYGNTESSRTQEALGPQKYALGNHAFYEVSFCLERLKTFTRKCLRGL